MNASDVLLCRLYFIAMHKMSWITGSHKESASLTLSVPSHRHARYTMSYNHKNHIKVTFVPKVCSVLVFSSNLKVTSIHSLMNWFVWCGLNFITMHEQSMNNRKCHKLSVPGRTCYDEKYDVRLRWKFKWHRVAHHTL